MPLFMFLSGYVFYWSCKNRSLKEIIIIRVRGIGIPMIIWGTISWFIELINLLSNRDFMFSLKTIKGLLSQILEIWFLWAVLLSSLIVAIVYKLYTKKFGKYLLMFLLAGVLIFFPNHTTNLFVYPYFVLGFLFNEFHIANAKSYKTARLFTIPIWIIMLFFFKKEHYIYTSGISPFSSSYGFSGQIIIDLFRYTIGFIGLIAIWEITQFIYRQTNWIFPKITIEQVGLHSLELYVIQRLFLEIFIPIINAKSVDQFGSNIFIVNRALFDYVITPICTIVIYWILSTIIKVLEKNRYLSLLLFGKS